MITQEELKQLLDYNVETGVFTWLSDSGSNKIKGLVAGYFHKSSGYNNIGIKGKIYQEHRIIWFYVYGVWPENYIDHINGVKTDNRISNLREATHSQNGQNTYKHRKGRLVGATYIKRNKKWMAQIHINGKTVYLGLFKTEQEAHEAYLIKLKELNK